MSRGVGVYRRPNSPYWWASLGRPGQPPLRISTKIPLAGATAAQTKENRRLAQAAYASMMGDLARERFNLPGPSIAFDQHARWYAEHHTSTRRSPTSRVRELQILERLRAWFGRLPLEAIRPARWQEYATGRLNAGAALGSISRELGVMKAVLNTAVGEHIDYNPLVTVKRKNPKLKPKRTITRKDEPRFLKALKRIDRELHDMYLVGVGTLLRRENLIYLQRRHYRGDHLSVDTKTGPHRVPLTGPTPLQRRAAAVLRRRLPRAPDGYFFQRWHAIFAPYANPGHPGKRFLWRVRQAAAAAGLEWGLENDGIVWHTATRASGATRMLREHKVDVRTVQLVGNWASLTQMAEYLGIDREVFGV